MKNFFYNLNGGINTAKTKVGKAESAKKLSWDDSKNVEILKNQGICRCRGNVLILDKGADFEVVGISEYGKGTNDFVFAGANGEIYYYERANDVQTLVHTFTEPISTVLFTKFLDGLIILTDSNPPVYFKRGADVEPLNLEDADGTAIIPTSCAVYANRVWLSHKSTLYFSALGTYCDWTTPDDAGYISKFHSSTSKITAMMPYCGSLAVYNADEVYLLTGSTPDDFSIARFADTGTKSARGVVCADNKQFFVNNHGVFYLAQAGILSQIALYDNLAENVFSFFHQINYSQMPKSLALVYENKNQLWFFLPFSNYLNTVLIYDFSSSCWLKRVIPYQISTGATVCGKILTGTDDGKIFEEDCGNSFSGLPIEFEFSSPFFHLGAPTTRKIIEDFNFIFDEEHENRFKFSVSKDYISQERTDVDTINTTQPQSLVWVDNSTLDDFNSVWDENENDYEFFWALPLEEAYRTEIFDANTSVQLHITGDSIGDDFAIVGIEFKEILIDP